MGSQTNAHNPPFLHDTISQQHLPPLLSIIFRRFAQDKVEDDRDQCRDHLRRLDHQYDGIEETLKTGIGPGVSEDV